MWRVSGGWSNILHVVGGRMQYIVTHPVKRVRKIPPRRKGWGVGDNGYVIFTYPLFIIIIYIIGICNSI